MLTQAEKHRNFQKFVQDLKTLENSLQPGIQSGTELTAGDVLQVAYQVRDLFLPIDPDLALDWWVTVVNFWNEMDDNRFGLAMDAFRAGVPKKDWRKADKAMAVLDAKIQELKGTAHKAKKAKARK